MDKTQTLSLDSFNESDKLLMELVVRVSALEQVLIKSNIVSEEQIAKEILVNMSMLNERLKSVSTSLTSTEEKPDEIV